MATPVRSSRDQCGKMKKNIAAPPAKYRINNEGPRYDYSVMAVKKSGKMKARSTSSGPSIKASMDYRSCPNSKVLLDLCIINKNIQK